MQKVCCVPGCNKPHRAHGFCVKHLYRWEKYSDPTKASFKKHGQKKNNLRMYRTWQSMKDRCYNPNSKAYKNYGGRGIRICDKWLGVDGFANFLNDMGERPKDKHSIDRIDPDGPYSPDNCRWATWEQQENNRRINKYYEYAGKRMTLPQWSRELGINLHTLHYRRYVKKLDVPELLAPVDTKYSR